MCVWQRLNDGLGKLGLPDVVFGPDLFFPCPLESQDDHSIYEYVIHTKSELPRGKTNNVVSEQVRHKPGSTSTEKSKKLEILELIREGIVLSE